jgi:hypothetical protein
MRKLVYCLIACLPIVAAANVRSDSTQFVWERGLYATIDAHAIKVSKFRNVYFGVSDAGLQPEVARKQAVQRAIFLYGLRQGAQVKVVTDLFKMNDMWRGRDYPSEKITTMASVFVNVDNIKYEVVDEYTDAFGECFVWLKIKPKETGYSMRAILNVVCSQNDNEIAEIICRLGMQDSAMSVYETKGTFCQKQVTSKWDKDSLQLPEQYCFYNNYGKVHDEQDEMDRSFFSAFLYSLSHDLLFYPYNDAKHRYKKVEDSYNTINYNLSRGTTEAQIALKLQLMAICGNQLKTEWKEERIK